MPHTPETDRGILPQSYARPIESLPRLPARHHDLSHVQRPVGHQIGSFSQRPADNLICLTSVDSTIRTLYPSHGILPTTRHFSHLVTRRSLLGSWRLAKHFLIDSLASCLFKRPTLRRLDDHTQKHNHNNQRLADWPAGLHGVCKRTLWSPVNDCSSSTAVRTLPSAPVPSARPSQV